MAMPCKLATLIFAFSALAAGGCRGPDVKDYIPPQEAARQALAAALDAWKEGKTPETIGASDPKIEVQDKQWRAGKKLTAYEIIGPTKGPDPNARFEVRLTLAGVAVPQQTVYIVVGKDPLWVFSEESYNKASGM